MTTVFDPKKVVGVPTLVWAEVRQDIYYCGFSDELRGAYDAMRYAMHSMSESEYTEMYQSGSFEYRTAADQTVRSINQKAGK